MSDFLTPGKSFPKIFRSLGATGPNVRRARFPPVRHPKPSSRQKRKVMEETHLFSRSGLRPFGHTIVLRCRLHALLGTQVCSGDLWFLRNEDRLTVNHNRVNFAVWAPWLRLLLFLFSQSNEMLTVNRNIWLNAPRSSPERERERVNAVQGFVRSRLSKRSGDRASPSAWW